YESIFYSVLSSLTLSLNLSVCLSLSLSLSHFFFLSLSPTHFLSTTFSLLLSSLQFPLLTSSPPPCSLTPLQISHTLSPLAGENSSLSLSSLLPCYPFSLLYTFLFT